MNKVIDFRNVLFERTQQSIHCKVHKIVETTSSLTTIQSLKLHFKEWLMIEKEKTEHKNQFTNHL
jgi:hypothetical protein